jgi:hypothetical protein
LRECLKDSCWVGLGQVAGGPARLHRPPEHLRLKVLLHGPEPGRGGEALVAHHCATLSLLYFLLAYFSLYYSNYTSAPGLA